LGEDPEIDMVTYTILVYIIYSTLIVIGLAAINFKILLIPLTKKLISGCAILYILIILRLLEFIKKDD